MGAEIGAGDMNCDGGGRGAEVGVVSPVPGGSGGWYPMRGARYSGGAECGDVSWCVALIGGRYPCEA